MANLLQIKRSLTNAIPGALANGEQAYTSNGDVLYIGANGQIVPIGGKRTPGVLTANQALVANSTSGIDKIIVANANITSVYANGSLGTPGQVLTSNGTVSYWSTVSAGSGALSGLTDVTLTSVANNNLLVYNGTSSKWENRATGNGVTFNSQSLSVLAGTGIVSNATGVHVDSTYIGTITANNSNYLAGFTWAAPGAIGSGTANSGVFTYVNTTGQVNTATLFATTSANVGGNVQITTSQYGITGNTTTAPTMALSGTGLVGGNSTITGSFSINIANSIGNTVITTTQTTISNSTAAFYVANSTGVFHNNGTINATSHSTSGTVANTLGVYPTSNTVGTALGSTTQRWILNANTINASGLITGTAGATITGTINASASIFVGANVFLSNTAVNVGNTTTNTVISTSGITIGNSTATTTSTINVANTTGNSTIGATYIQVANATVLTFSANTTKLAFAGANVDFASSTTRLGDTFVTGNLTVTGTMTTVDTVNLQVTDSLIRLAQGQAGTTTYTDAVDIGFYGLYGNTLNTNYTGLARDSASGEYVLFKDATTNPDNTGVTTSLPLATMYAYLKSGGLVSNGTAITLTANSTLSVNMTANSLTLTTPLAATSGGTGLGTFTSGDILVANTGNALSKLGLGADGYVLQSNGTALVYGTLDGGTF